LLLPPPNGHARLLVLAGNRCGVGEGEAESGVGSCVGEGTGMEGGGAAEGTRRVTVLVGESVLEWYMWPLETVCGVTGVITCPGCPCPSFSLRTTDDDSARSVLVSVCVLFTSLGCRNKRWKPSSVSWSSLMTER